MDFISQNANQSINMLHNYPPIEVHSSNGDLNVLQLTDLHVFFDSCECNSEIYADCKDSFEHCLSQALADPIECDLILVTGDLVNELNPRIYDGIFATLTATGIPFACIAGNHDVTDEVGKGLPFEQRSLIAHEPDHRLLNQHVIESEFWQILLIDSSVPGKIHGYLTAYNANWLSQQLSQNHKPSIICLHHHVMPMQSKWIDEHILLNFKEFWHIIDAFPHVQCILSGHTHQENMAQHNNVTAYTTPSTCYQFKTKSDDFTYDFEENPGYRWLTLKTDGTIQSWVNRVQVRSCMDVRISTAS